MKEIIGTIAAVLSIIGHTPYISDILKNKTKPHVFTWIVWSIITILIFFGQVQKGGGPGAWTVGITGLIAVFITVLSFRKGTKDITSLDKIFFSIAILSIIPWYLTNDPTLSVVILTLIDVSAFIPTIRKTIKNPDTETLFTYGLNIPRHGLSILAITNYNLATYIFPAALVIMNIVMVAIIIGRRIKKAHN